MRFQAHHLQYFGASDGAFSEITAADEETKGQITLTNHEVTLVEEHFGAGNIHVGPKKNDPTKAVKEFNFYNNIEIISLVLVYPKPAKTELRLYMNLGEGFSPAAGQVWFVFSKNADPLLTVGYIDKGDWDDISTIVSAQQTVKQANITIDDSEDDEYQSDIQDLDARGPVKRTTKQYPRNPLIAFNRMKRIGYLCEYDNSHQTFISMKTGHNFLEAHHIIPMGAQPDFGITLDLDENIAILCPNCHRAIHHGTEGVKEQYLNMFHANRIAALSATGINVTIDKLKEYYGVSP